MIPLLTSQKLMSHIDGSILPPTKTINIEGKSMANPDYTSWYEADKRVVILLLSSLSVEVIYEVLGLSTVAQIWSALQYAYRNFLLNKFRVYAISFGNSTKVPYRSMNLVVVLKVYVINLQQLANC